jgi:hypothetical protein
MILNYFFMENLTMWFIPKFYWFYIPAVIFIIMTLCIYQIYKIGGLSKKVLLENLPVYLIIFFCFILVVLIIHDRLLDYITILKLK